VKKKITNLDPHHTTSRLQAYLFQTFYLKICHFSVILLTNKRTLTDKPKRLHYVLLRSRRPIDSFREESMRRPNKEQQKYANHAI